MPEYSICMPKKTKKKEEENRTTKLGNELKRKIIICFQKKQF